MTRQEYAGVGTCITQDTQQPETSDLSTGTRDATKLGCAPQCEILLVRRCHFLCAVCRSPGTSPQSALRACAPPRAGPCRCCCLGPAAPDNRPPGSDQPAAQTGLCWAGPLLVPHTEPPARGSQHTQPPTIEGCLPHWRGQRSMPRGSAALGASPTAEEYPLTPVGYIRYGPTGPRFGF